MSDVKKTWILNFPLKFNTQNPINPKILINIQGKKLENQIKSLIVLVSYHHNNTEKIAKIFAQILNSQINCPEQINPQKVHDFDLIGFGSGIYSDRHHQSLFDLTDKLPKVKNKKTFIFSTSGMTGEDKITNDHLALKKKLQAKGYLIIDEFQCKGFNTNSFLRFFGGMNKGRPNAEDLEHAKEFAQNLKQNLPNR